MCHLTGRAQDRVYLPYDIYEKRCIKGFVSVSNKAGSILEFRGQLREVCLHVCRRSVYHYTLFIQSIYFSFSYASIAAVHFPFLMYENSLFLLSFLLPINKGDMELIS